MFSMGIYVNICVTLSIIRQVGLKIKQLDIILDPTYKLENKGVTEKKEDFSSYNLMHSLSPTCSLILSVFFILRISLSLDATEKYI